MVIFSGITEKECVKERYTPTLDSEKSNCATLRCHLSNNWDLAGHGSRSGSSCACESCRIPMTQCTDESPTEPSFPCGNALGERRVRMSKKHRQTYVFHVQYVVNEPLAEMFLLPVLCEVANTKHSHWLAGLSVASHWESWVHLFRMHSVHFDPPSQSILIHTQFIEGESSKLCHMFGSQIWQSTCKFGVLSPKTWSPQTACFG